MSATAKASATCFPRHGLAVDAGGEIAGALRVAIGDQDAPGVVLVQVPGGALAHLPRAEDERRRVRTPR